MILHFFELIKKCGKKSNLTTHFTGLVNPSNKIREHDSQLPVAASNKKKIMGVYLI